MPTFKGNLTRALLIAMATSILLSGCAGSEKSEAEKAEESVKRKFGDEGLITVEIVFRAYDQGRLGTREQVEADMEPFFSYPGEDKIPKPLDSSGKFIPLTAMNDEQIHAFSRWYNGGKVALIIHDEVIAAITELREKKSSKD